MFSINPTGFSHDEYRQGYALRNDMIYFLFDDRLYDVPAPLEVGVAGTFSGWHHNEMDQKWLLKRIDDNIWAFAYENGKHKIHINEHTEFKYRVNAYDEDGYFTIGIWAEPKLRPSNMHRNNFVFSNNEPILWLKPELRKIRGIWVTNYNCPRSLDKKDYSLTNAKQQTIEIEDIIPIEENVTLIVPKIDLDLRKSYYLCVTSLNLMAQCSHEPMFRETYSSKTLGANISPDNKNTTFRIFAPRAERIKLYLYRNPEDEASYATHELGMDDQGVWEIVIKENLKGVYYDYTVHGEIAKGNHFYELEPVHISDPYARVMTHSTGKGRVWEREKPAKPLKTGIPNMEDVVAYEVHVQDFTEKLPVPPELKGTFEAMCLEGLKNEKGASVGFDYLVGLGINVLHLMPIQEFWHYPDEEWEKSFSNDKFMQKMGVDKQNYDWGYRTTHAFAVESSYRNPKTEHGEQRRSFKNLVQKFHEKGIAVIIDIVPNHTGENIEGIDRILNFNGLDKLYYYRTKNLDHIGGMGNEVKTENRPMVQRWLIDQCKHFIEEFGIDGFRIDLAGQIDKQTLKALVVALGKDKIIYGEPWIGSDDPDYENNPSWDWYKHDSPITFFQDEFRNAIQGGTDDVYDKYRDRGYAGGNTSFREAVKTALANHYYEEYHPNMGISYLDIHDNWALADRFAVSESNGLNGVEEDRYKIAVTLLLTSVGALVLHGGSEIMRSKGIVERYNTVKQTINDTKIYINGRRDTYNLKTPNLFLWENVGKNQTDGVVSNFQEMYEFWQGLIKFRLSEKGKVFRQSKRLSGDYYRWLEPENRNLLGYFIDNQVLVLLNVGVYDDQFDHIWLPEGSWHLIGTNKKVDHVKSVPNHGKLVAILGEKHHNFPIPACGLRIWLRE